MVDADTAAAVFNKCILKALKDRTVILVTRHVQVDISVQEGYFLLFAVIMKSACIANFTLL